MRGVSLFRLCLSTALVVVAGPALSARIAAADSTNTAPWTISGDLRERATYVSAIDFDEDAPGTDWFWTQRLRFNGDFDGGGALSGRITVMSAMQAGGAISPVERNNLDIQEGWLQYAGRSSWARVGRQEIRLGSQRLVGWRDGTNVRRTWDGVRAGWLGKKWTVDAFALQLVDVEVNGIFNDPSNDDRVLAGVYATRTGHRTNFDVFYLYARFDERQTIEGLVDQERHSLGVRGFGERGPVFWNWEAVYQFGRHGTGDIRAWTIATNTGYRFDAKWSPAIMLSANVASGDTNPGDGTLETFDALYPRGSYFSELAQLGPANFFNVNPYFMVSPAQNLTVSLDLNFYWRLETTDGVYGPPGNIIRVPGDTDERFVNTAVSVAVEWGVTENMFLGLSLTHSRPETFIAATGPSDTANFAEFTFEAGFY